MYKILFSSAIAAVLIFGSSAFANPDSDDNNGYQDYSYTDGSRSSDTELTNNSRFQNDDEDDFFSSKPQRNSRQQDYKEDVAYEGVAYRNLDVNKKEEAPKAKFKDKSLHVGFHAGGGFAGTWHNQKAYGEYLNTETWEIDSTEKDPFAGYMGFIVEFGFIVNYRLLNFLCIVPGINFRMVDYMKESEVWYLKVDRGWYKESYPLDENMMIMGINLPLVVRLAISKAYIELGGEMNFNLMTSYSLTNSEFDYEEDMGGYWEANTFVWGLVFGGGVTLDADDGDAKAADIGLRVIVDMGPIEKDEVVDMRKLGIRRNSVETRMWTIQFVINFYLI